MLSEGALLHRTSIDLPGNPLELHVCRKMPPVVTAVERSGPPVVLRAASCRARLSGRRPWCKNGRPLGRAVLAPKRRSRKAQIDQAVPFQDSTRVRTTPLLFGVLAGGLTRPRRDTGHSVEICHGRARARHDRPDSAVPGFDQGLTEAVAAVVAHGLTRAGGDARHAVEGEHLAGASRWRPLYDGNELRGWLHARRYVLGPRAVGPSRCVGQGRLRRWRTSGLSALALCCRNRGAAPIEVSGAPGVKG